MDASTAFAELKSTSKFIINQTRDALRLHAWSNSDSENRRLEAANWAIKNWKKYFAYCKAR